MALTLAQLAPQPRSRSFIVGSTGSGKSTLASRLLEEYRRLHPTHPIYIVDPKRRFFADPRPDDPLLFPNGPIAYVRNNRIGVVANARLLHQPDGYKYKHENSFLVQDAAKCLELFDHLYAHPNAKRPALLYLDESFDFVRGTRADPGLRRLFQQGRELSVGCMVINQRPAWVDKTFLTETERLYVGMLHYDEDRLSIAKQAPISEPKRLLDPLPAFTWWLLDRQHPERSHKFRLMEAA